ncbi:hypothetical protein HID58_079992, partial [Brassica napus]
WTACSIQLARSASWTDPTRRTGELVGASGLTPPFGELDDGCFAVRDLLFEALSNLSRRLIVFVMLSLSTVLDSSRACRLKKEKNRAGGGKLDGVVGPTRPFGELDGLLDPTRPFGELVSAFGPTRPFDELDNGCFAVWDPLSEALSNLSRRLIV